jgi:hypothetical protein
MRARELLAVALLANGMGACWEFSPHEQSALSGGALGAAGGAMIGTAVGAGPVAGAAIGAAAGAMISAWATGDEMHGGSDT